MSKKTLKQHRETIYTYRAVENFDNHKYSCTCGGKLNIEINK